MSDNIIYQKSTNVKRSDRFSVKFKGIPENVGDILTREVKSVERPSVSLNFDNQPHKGKPIYHNLAAEFQPIRITFFDDDNSLVSGILYAQIFRQLNKHVDLLQRDISSVKGERVYKFDIEIELYNTNGDAVEGFVLKECFINSLIHTDPIIGDDEQTNEINITVVYNDVDIKVFDTFLAALEAYNQNSKEV